jgi:hypothetical protein
MWMATTCSVARNSPNFRSLFAVVKSVHRVVPEVDRDSDLVADSARRGTSAIDPIARVATASFVVADRDVRTALVVTTRRGATERSPIATIETETRAARVTMVHRGPKDLQGHRSAPRRRERMRSKSESGNRLSLAPGPV